MTPEQEIKLLKGLLYCTKRSCNNCGKVNCENFQRQRIDCCGLWVSYKDYIAELENKIADLKANADLAIEGRDVKIMKLETENNKLLDVINNYEVKIADLEKENAELRNNGFTVSAMTEQQLKVALEKGEQLEKENAELKGRNEGFEQQIMGLLIKYEEVYKRFPDLKSAMDKAQTILKENTELKKKCYKKAVKDYCKLEQENAELREESDFYNKERGNYKAMYLKEILKKKRTKDLLTKATEIIKELLDSYKYVTRFREYANKKPIADAEHFLKEIEKWQ